MSITVKVLRRIKCRYSRSISQLLPHSSWLNVLDLFPPLPLCSNEERNEQHILHIRKFVDLASFDLHKLQPDWPLTSETLTNVQPIWERGSGLTPRWGGVDGAFSRNLFVFKCVSSRTKGMLHPSVWRCTVDWWWRQVLLMLMLACFNISCWICWMLRHRPEDLTRISTLCFY